MRIGLWICTILYVCPAISCIILVIPEDVPAGLAAIYGFAPKLITGNDHRLGFGFRLGNHADFQVTYELGPQTYTRPQQPTRIRSATYRQRLVRRRPFLELLLSLGILKEATYEFTVVNEDNVDNEPR
ncbi:hypothetical protein ACJJTC_019085 [Scirpophaga incertulas]